MKAKGYVMQFFPKKGLLSTHQSAKREPPTVLYRLPTLMAADKPCPKLQPSLVFNSSKKQETNFNFLDF